MLIDVLWHLRGSVSLERSSGDEAVLGALKRFLVKKYKPVTSQGPDHLTFDAPLLDSFFHGQSALTIYDRGHFRIVHGSSGRRLHYDLRSLHGMVFCLYGAAVCFAFGTLADSLRFGAELAALAFGWLYGGNLLLAVVRVPFAIRKSVRQARVR
jgi:hypothetical protein|tara:strand:- start:1254 stop:1715 length:462 start_codon:yes stop_codon:yes gene_type:complete